MFHPGCHLAVKSAVYHHGHRRSIDGDASREGAFQSEAYVLARQPKSVLCMPILHQKKRAGLLYLENELLANAFTPERCEVLELLAAQAAISLENAKLYDTLDARVDINALVQEHVNLAMVGHDAQKGALVLTVTLHADYDEALGSEVIIPEEIGRVILNLLNNALYALELKKRRLGDGFIPVLEVKTRNLEERFELRIRDNGEGIQAAQKDKIFTPFFTTKPPGEGTGLGLSISHDIVVQGHGGSLVFMSEEGEFTEFVVTLPKRAN
jgi:signal transduction histidine kinase